MIQVMPAVVFAAAVIINGPVFASENIEHSDIVESLSIPSQHIARVIADGHELSDSEAALISKAADMDMIADTYNANISDPIKNLIRTTGDVEYLSSHKSDYMKLWIELGKKYPGSYLRAQIDQTKGYWYPDVNYWTMSNYCDDSDVLEVYKDRHTPQWINTVLGDIGFYAQRLPIVGLLFSIGFAAWITLALFALCCVNSQKRVLTVFIPIIALELTLIAVTPVYAEFRYAYPMFTTLPALCIIPFIPSEKKIGENDG